MFLRHEGFLGAQGAFMSYEKQSLMALWSIKYCKGSPSEYPLPAISFIVHYNSDSNENERVYCIQNVASTATSHLDTIYKMN